MSSGSTRYTQTDKGVIILDKERQNILRGAAIMKIEMTVSTQVKSDNAVSDIENHSGKKNREKFNHKNPDIDTSLSHLNVEMDFYDREELLHKHYDEKIKKHNENNRGEKRHWDLNKFLDTFEGKEVKMGGKSYTRNPRKRWSTLCQISYFGSDEMLNPVLEAIAEAGASDEEILEAYTAGYKNYVIDHNKEFKTLPIYNSNIHFDEATPHGHDAIVVMGHTKSGNPSDSFNNALSEHYNDYPPNFKGKSKQMKRYRQDNDKLIMDNVGNALSDLANQYGLEIDFELLRTGEYYDDSPDSENYKKRRDEEKRAAALEKQRETVVKLTKTNNKRRDENRTEARELKNRASELDEREKGLNTREKALDAQNAHIGLRERNAQNKLDSAKELSQKVYKHANFYKAVALSVLDGVPNYARPKARIEKDDFTQLSDEDIARVQKVMKVALDNAHNRTKPLTDVKTIQKTLERPVVVDDGPEL